MLFYNKTSVKDWPLKYTAFSFCSLVSQAREHFFILAQLQNNGWVH